MSLDSLSPIAPARVRALVLPLGQIRSRRFSAFVERLQEEHVVHLRDITADGRPNRTMFSPLAFPAGAIFYELITHAPPPSHLAISPFELFREPLAIIAVADGKELHRDVISKRSSLSGRAPTLVEQNVRSLSQELEDIRDAYGKALVHHVLIFDYEDPEGHEIPMPEGIIAVPPAEKCKRTTMKGIMADVSSLLLAEMTTLAKSIEGTNFIDSPGQLSSRQNGAVWTADEANGHVRRNSQFAPHVARSSSSSGFADKSDRSQVRMSMPPIPFKSSPSILNHANSPRPSTPKSGLSSAPTTFEDMAGLSDSGRTTPEPGQPRPETPEGLRAVSQERVSVQGFGSGGQNDRWRLKGKARSVVVVGSLYLQAGRWTDALRELVEGASMARSVNDHIWHGKALELITICLFLLAWAGMEFQIPMVCFPIQEKPPPDGGLKDLENLDPNQPQHLRNLQVILPDLLDRIVGLYTKMTSESLPPLPLSEAIIRFCKMLSALHLADGTLGEDSLRMIVLGEQPERSLTTCARLTVKPSRQHIVSLAFRAFPASPELLTTIDRASILSGIAAVLGPLGQHRKKGLVIRELLSVLIDGLVEARTRGAAEVGIHPAAGLIALSAAEGQSKASGSIALELQEGDVEQGIDALLDVLCKTYGIVSLNPGQPSSGTQAGGVGDSGDSAVTRIHRHSAARLFGFPSIKVNVLRACINFSEALPDFNGVMKFSSDLLRTAGSGAAPGPRREDASPIITREEQIRLVTNISKTYALSQKVGLNHLAGEYWDELLVRDIVLDPLSATKAPVPHSKSAITGVTTSRTSQDVDPFIYNPFLKKNDKAAVEQTLVVGETATFRVTLQNPYELELDIESIKLHGEGVDFESRPESTVIGPYRTQVLKVSLVPKAAGTLKVTAAVVRVRGCRERQFSIFSQPWVPRRDYKPKSTGLTAFEKAMAREGTATPSLTTSELDLKVIPEQPTLAVRTTSLPQSCVMILEGERQVFSVTLQNTSKTTAVDFILFSFMDSTQGPLQAALNNRDSTPTELYECELILMKKQALKLRNKSREKRYIAPGATATFEFEVLGKPGLTNATIQIDYAHLGRPLEEAADEFYTRRVNVQLTVTVNASVEISRYDIIPLDGGVPAPLWNRVRKTDAEEGVALPADQYCLLSLDLINVWPSTMLFRIEGQDDVEVEEYILPGNITRVVIPVRRIFIEDPHASIPVLNPKRNRQFVVSSSKTTPDFERGVREAFWYREKLLESLKATWRTLTGPQRDGIVELRVMRLAPRMVDALKIEDVGIDLFVEGGAGEESDSQGSIMYVDEFSSVRVKVTNRTARPIYPLVRLMPALCHRPTNVALDHARKFAWNGTLQRALPLLGPRSSTEVVLGVTALCRGQFEITASVEETMLWKDANGEKEEREKNEGGGRRRADTQSMADSVLGKRERRIWHARRAYVVSVRDRE